MSLRKFVPWIVGLMALVAGCSHQTQTKYPAEIISTPTASVDMNQGGYWNQPATFWSRETGPVLLNSIGGDRPNPCVVTKLYISLVNSSDVGKFVSLIETHRKLPTAKIDDPTSGHMIYTLHDILVTGKTMPPVRSYPQITLQVGSMTINKCGPDKSLHALHQSSASWQRTG